MPWHGSLVSAEMLSGFGPATLALLADWPLMYFTPPFVVPLTHSMPLPLVPRFTMIRHFQTDWVMPAPWVEGVGSMVPEVGGPNCFNTPPHCSATKTSTGVTNAIVTQLEKVIEK